MSYWHFYGRRISRGDLRGVFLTVLVGPAEEAHLPPKRLRALRSTKLKYLGAFDHEPTQIEQEALRDRRLCTTYLKPVPVKRR